MNLFGFPQVFLICFLLLQTGCTTTPQKKTTESKVSIQTRLPTSKDDSNTKINQQDQQNLINIAQIKLELKEVLLEKHAIQEQLSSLNIANKTPTKKNAVINTSYESQINKLNRQLNKLLITYTDNDPEVKETKRMIKTLEAQHLAKMKSEVKSTEFNKQVSANNPIHQDLQLKLISLNHKIGTLNIRLLENQQRYNDYHKLNYVPSAKGRIFEHPGGLHSASQLENARTKIAMRQEPWTTEFEALIQQVQKGLDKPPEAVIDFNVPGHYQDAKGHRIAMKRLSRDAWKAYFSAIAYQLSSGKNKTLYANKAIQILNAWSTINKKTSNFDGNLAMITAGTGLVFAAELMTDYDGWTNVQRKDFKNWLTTVFLKSCSAISEQTNNWGDWGALGSITAYYFLDDAAALNTTIQSLIRKIDFTIAADGSMPLETKRGKNGIWYTYFALAPLTSASQIALNARNINLFQFKGMDGAGIEEALDYLLRYTIKPRKWPYYRGKDLSIPKSGRWPDSLFEAMYGSYGKKEYKAWITDKGPELFFGHHYAWSVPTLLRTKPPPQ